MPYLKKKSFERLVSAGNQAANVCYNLSQRDGQHAADTMKDAQERWDRVLRSVRAEIRKPIPTDKKEGE